MYKLTEEGELEEDLSDGLIPRYMLSGTCKVIKDKLYVIGNWKVGAT